MASTGVPSYYVLGAEVAEDKRRGYCGMGGKPEVE